MMTLPLDVSASVPMAQGAPLICSVVIWSMKAKYFFRQIILTEAYFFDKIELNAKRNRG